MTPERINKAIAEHCGWTNIQKNIFGTLIGNPPETHSQVELRFIPDYYHDLNAMHEAEKMLTPAIRDLYHDRLWEIMADYSCGTSVEGAFGIYHATAPQRAEAFLRTVGKWEE